MADIVPVNGIKADIAAARVQLDMPEILDIPPKLTPIISEFNAYKLLYLEGGRGSGKTHSTARFLLYLGEQRKIRIVCGREIQANIEESVYTVLVDLIEKYNLAYDVFKHKIIHKFTGTKFTFKGFREQGNVSVKGLEGVDILWIDEAQSITKNTLDIIVPTIRKEKAKIIFTMNRFMRDDAVHEFCTGRADCLHITINYFENPHCPLTLKIEAEEVRAKSERDYNHIYLGHPLATADDYLFNYDKLHSSFDVTPFGETFMRQRVLGIDFAAQGNDQCVATVLDRVSNQHWKLVERIAWDEPDTMVSTGKIVNMIAQFKPTASMIDIGGLGKPVYDRLIEVGMNINPFDGGSTHGVDIKQYGNIRAKSYFTLREWFDQKFLCIDRKDIEVVKQLEKIKMVYRSNGSRLIEPKVKMKKTMGYSPDDADSLNMAVWCAITCLGNATNTASDATEQPKRVNKTRRTR